MKTVPYAPFHTRALAQILDGLWLFAVLAPLLYLLNILLLPQIESTTGLFIYSLIRLLLTATLAITLQAWCLTRYGATPGKILTGLKVTDQQTGLFLSYKRAVLRVLLGYVAILSSIGVLLVLVDGKRQGVHDKLLHTLVIHYEDDYAHMELPAHWRPPHESA